MKPLSDERWALIGRVLAAIGSIVAIVSGSWVIIDRVSGASLSAVATLRPYSLAPSIREEFSRSVYRDSVLALIPSMLTNGASASNSLMRIREEMTDTNSFTSLAAALRRDMPSSYLEVNVINDGGDVAKEVRLSLSGKGTAEISEGSGPVLAADTISLTWSGGIPLGEIRPGGVLNIRVWSERYWVQTVRSINPVLHHSKGTVRVRELREFYGPYADFGFWWIAQGKFIKSAIILAPVIIMFITVKLLLLKRRVRTPARKRASNSGVE
jgi:hypothetical protein